MTRKEISMIIKTSLFYKRKWAWSAPLTLPGTLATTSATKEVYGQSYAYSGKLGNNSYVSWNIKGDSSTAMTTAGKTESKFQRYIKVSVECRNTANNAVITNQTNEITTKNAGTGIGIKRNKNNSYVYYIHRVKVKTDKDNQYTIDDVYYRINQNK